MPRNARVFHRREPIKGITELNVTPLLDLAFSMLIIFMVSTPLLEQSIEIQLPEESPRSLTRNLDDSYQVINIDAEGQVFWGEEAVDRELLTERLGLLALEGEPPVVRVRADGRLSYQQVMDVVDLIKNANLTRLSLETRAR